MLEVTTYAGERVAILGLGRSGLSAARALFAGGADVHAWDDDAARCAQAGDAGILTANLYDANWDDFAALVLSPGIPLTHPAPHPLVVSAQRANCEIVGDIELFAREKPVGRIAAITGTNGKSTTTELIGHLLKSCGISVAVGGNVGFPVLDLPKLSSDGAYVIELSSYQIDLAPSLAADVAVLLNLSPDHLERHGSMQGYIAAKRQLFERQRAGQVAIVGVDDPDSRTICDDLRRSNRGRVIAISASAAPDCEIFVQDGRLHDKTSDSGDDTPLADLHAARDLKGTHNWQNSAAAYAVAQCLGGSSDCMTEGLLSFPGLAHRMEDLGAVAGVRFVNDSKATNPDAATRALSCYDSVFWIAGGRAKDVTLQSLEPLFPKIAHAFLIGEAAPLFADALAGHVPTTILGDLESAVTEAHTRAMGYQGSDPVILLSPACVSFDQFSDFEERGNRFRELVRIISGLHAR